MEKLFTSMDDLNSFEFSCVNMSVTWYRISISIWHNMATNEIIKSTGPTIGRFSFQLTDAVNWSRLPLKTLK